MARKPPLSPAELDQIRQLHADGESCNSIARQLERSASTISKAARQLGLSWDASRTEAATEAHKATSAEKRARLEGRLLDEAALLLDQLHQPHLVYSFGGRDNTYASKTLPEPDVAAKRQLVQAAGVAIDKAIKLADVDRAGAAAEAGKSLVGGLFHMLRSTASEQPEDDSGPATE